MSLPWIEKYRPKELVDIAGHDDKINAIHNMISNNSFMNMIFYGQCGSGKTSLIHICSNILYKEHKATNVLELNASKDRGIKVVRENIPDFIRIMSDKKKLIILDEADSMTQEAQDALKSVIDDNINICSFCIICNNINKISTDLQSRCFKLCFSSLDDISIKKRLQYICDNEKLNITEKSLDILVNYKKDLRYLINVLQGIHNISDGSAITEDIINNYISIITVKDFSVIYDMLINTKYEYIYVCKFILNMYLNNNWNLKEFINIICTQILNDENINIVKKTAIIKGLSDIDVNISITTNISIQIYYLVGLFY